MGRLIALFFLALPLFAVECTSVTASNKTLIQRGNATVIHMNIAFVGDVVTSHAPDFTFSGAVTQATIDDLAFDVCATLTGFASLTVGAITPAELLPTPKEQAILDINEAARQLCALENYASLVGLAGTDDVAGLTMNLNGRRANLTAVINTNASASWNQVKTRLLDEWISCTVDSPGNARTSVYHSTTDVIDPPKP